MGRVKLLIYSYDGINALFIGGVVNYSHYDLKQRQRGDTVEVTLAGNAANVFLVDSSNFSAYKAGRRYTYHGGHAKRSPVHLTVPRSGHWHLIVDLGGHRGTVKHSVRILPGPLKTLSDAPLSTVPSLIQGGAEADASDDVREFDVFISHASEDKDKVVRPLAMALQGAGLKVWYDEFELKIGDSLRRKIDKGLAKSRFGVVVLSKAFLSKGWTNYELDGIITRAISGEQVVLPIWHEITKQEVIDYSPSLADKLARSTANYTVDEIAAEIVEVIRT
ncbi:DUF1883 domain-containing protein [Lysobacter capsici]|uniref:DUF1883 domain-containing protein n=1 Tax=Lysobacter capsici TaxID=435897 RepID=UPI0019100268|nr:DUF1883 domain-containing protein [Lysobacter capsici]